VRRRLGIMTPRLLTCAMGVGPWRRRGAGVPCGEEDPAPRNGVVRLTGRRFPDHCAVGQLPVGPAAYSGPERFEQVVLSAQAFEVANKSLTYPLCPSWMAHLSTGVDEEELSHIQRARRKRQQIPPRAATATPAPTAVSARRRRPPVPPCSWR
jgi:hypothetical protein